MSRHHKVTVRYLEVLGVPPAVAISASLRLIFDDARALVRSLARGNASAVIALGEFMPEVEVGALRAFLLTDEGRERLGRTEALADLSEIDSLEDGVRVIDPVHFFEICGIPYVKSPGSVCGAMASKFPDGLTSSELLRAALLRAGGMDDTCLEAMEWLDGPEGRGRMAVMDHWVRVRRRFAVLESPA